MDPEKLIRFLIDKIGAELECADGAVPSSTRDACFHRADAYHRVLAQLDEEEANIWRQRIMEAQ